MNLQTGLKKDVVQHIFITDEGVNQNQANSGNGDFNIELRTLIHGDTNTSGTYGNFDFILGLVAKVERFWSL